MSSFGGLVDQASSALEPPHETQQLGDLAIARIPPSSGGLRGRLGKLDSRFETIEPGTIAGEIESETMLQS